MSKVILNFTEKKEQMDFQMEEDCNQIYKVFGEIEEIRQRFPYFHAALKRAQNGTPKEEQSGYRNWITIFAVSYDPDVKELQIDFNITLKQPCAELTALIYSGDISIYESVFYQNTQMENITCVFNNVYLEEGEKIDLYVECPYVAGNENVLRGIKESVSAVYTSDMVIKEIEVDHPRLLHNIESPIKVSYGRTLGRDEKIDYCYKEVRTEDGNQKVYLEVEGKVHLNENYTVKEVLKSQACVMAGGEHGTIVYSNPKGVEIAMFEKRNGFEYKFDIDWISSIPNSVQYGQREYIFDMGITFRCEKPDQIFRAHVCSIVKNPSSSEKKISKIRLYWGCLDSNSQIKLADGSVRSIKNIQIGDMVVTKVGVSPVKDIVRGVEEKLYKLVTTQGLSVDASIMHPILTEEGFIPIRDVTDRTKVVTEDGVQAVQYCYEVVYDDDVYGLELEGAESFLANGIFVGTNQVQGRMLGIAKYKESEECQLYRTEFQEMIAYAKTRGFLNGQSIKN